MNVKGKLKVSLLVMALSALMILVAPNAVLAAGQHGQKSKIESEEGYMKTTGTKTGEKGTTGEELTIDVEEGNTNTNTTNTMKNQTAAAEREVERGDLAETLTQANNVLQDMSNRAEERIPPAILENAAGIAIFPDLTKVGIGIGGSYGYGVLMVNENNNWSGPIFLSLFGASIGAQLGVESTDVLMVFNNRETLNDFSDGEITLGAETSVAAGPWGAKAAANTEADILVYKNTAGLFAGISVSGDVLTVDESANKEFLGTEESARAYFGSEEKLSKKKFPETQQVKQLKDSLSNYKK